jgi:hypothetical protein
MKNNDKTNYDTDVLVCGGGTSGIAAAWGAAKCGCTVTIIDENECIGGTPVNSLVNLMAYGAHDKKRWIIGGFFKEFRQRMIDAGYMIETQRKGWEPFNIEGYINIIYSMLDEAGVRVLCGNKIISVVSKTNRIKSIECISNNRKRNFKAKAYIDATGNGTVGVMAGCRYFYGNPETGVPQAYSLYYQLCNVDIDKAGAYLESLGKKGFWEKEDGSKYLNMTGLKEEVAAARENGDVQIARDHVANVSSVPGLEGIVSVNYGRINPYKKNISDIYTEGIGQAYEGLQFFKKYIPGFENAQVIRLAPQIGIRDGYRIEGKYIYTKDDVIQTRQFDDVIAQGCYMIDVHIPHSDRTKHIKLKAGTHYDIPMGTVISKKISNLFMAGKCISADYESLAAIRVQPIAMATGHGAGVIAAVSAISANRNDDINYLEVKKHLIDQGAILD